MEPVIYLETSRMRLRRFTPVDEDSLVALDSDPEVMRYLTGGIPTPRAVIARTVLPGFLRSYEPHKGFGVWATEDRSTGAFLGWFAFRPPEGASPDDVSLGYRLRRAAWGQGYATEAARALVRKGFTELGVRRVHATTYEHNVASRRVMERVGMRLVRSFRLTAADLAKTDTFDAGSLEVWDGDEVEYAIERAEWERQDARVSTLPGQPTC